MLVPALTTDLIECHLGAGKHVQAVVQDHPGNIVHFLQVLPLYRTPLVASSPNILSPGHLRRDDLLSPYHRLH